MVNNEQDAHYLQPLPYHRLLLRCDYCCCRSYADVLDSGKGWAGVVRFNSHVKAQFEAFRCVLE